MESYNEMVSMPDSDFRIKSFMASNLEQLINVHPHWHSVVEILYFIDGNARQQINENIFITEPGDIVVISKDQLHSTYSFAGISCNILVVMFDADNFFQTVLNKVDYPIRNIYGNAILFKNPIKTGSKDGNLLSVCLEEIYEEFNLKREGFQYILQSLLYKLAGFLIRYNLYDVCTIDAKSIREIKHLLGKTFELIDRHYQENITLTAAASNANLSVPHFCRLFKQATGMTFNDYLMLYRINRAERMLDSQKTLTEIALECGFGSIPSFIRSFKKFKSCTPSFYRKQQHYLLQSPKKND